MNQFKFLLVQAITILRFIGIPLVFIIPEGWVLFLYVSFLFLTDYIDGYLARKWNLTSTFGAIIDLLADKTIVLVLLANAAINNQIMWILFALIAFREIYSMVIRFKTMHSGKSLIKANMIGKTKTAFQMTGLAILIIPIQDAEVADFFIKLANLVLWASVVLAYWSFTQYFSQSKEKGAK